jgi:hypothetical protein
MQEKTAIDLEKTAGYRKSAFDSPDGAVLSLMAALPQGDTPTTLLFVDADEVARRGLDEEAWAGLTAEEQSKWRDCIRAGVKTWTGRDPAYFKLLQQVVDKVEVSGDLARVISHASLLGATSEIELFCKKSNGVWKICDISMPAISLSLKQQVRDSLKGVSMMGLTLKEALNRPDAEEILSKALLKVLEEGPQLESSLQGKSVTLIDGEGGVYEVIKQIEKEDGFWVLLRPEGGDPNALKWVQRSQTQEVQEEDEVWDLGAEASGAPSP